MNESLWYYVKGNKKLGPISESKMQEMFDKGDLVSETLIWSNTLTEWTPASNVQTFHIKSVPIPPPLPKQEKEVSQIRPWVRFWARHVDIVLIQVLVGIIFGLIAPALVQGKDLLFGFAILFAWVFIEAYLLSTWGTTPGKWLLRTTLRDSNSEKLLFSNAIGRSLSVWGNGLACGFPIINLIFLARAHKKLTKEGITKWDSECRTVIKHNRIGPVRVIVTILILLGFLILISFEKVRQ